ncbi:MAG TPA: hypothetical protein VLJ59_15140 [Mycobacteriales bacterium]|nr:hypothetical protein [Mycobacteriales bacterium]
MHPGWAPLLAVGLLTNVLLTACTATVAGTGRFSTTTASPPTASSTPSPTPSPTPEVYDQGRPALSCRGGTIIAPAGAPYCYRLPAGFRDVSKQVRLGAGIGNAKYLSAVGLAGRDLIVVLVYRPPSNTDLLPNAKIGQDLQAILTSLTRSGFVFATRTPTVGQVDRARAFTYHAVSKDRTFQSDLTFAFRGLSEVEVLCQYSDRKDAVQHACREVQATMQIRTVR